MRHRRNPSVTPCGRATSPFGCANGEEQTCEVPRRRARDNADRTKQRATAGAWVLEPNERGLRGNLANDGRKPRVTSIRPCGIGGRRCGLASLPSYPADWLRCLMRVPIAPAPDVPRRSQRSLPASTGRQAGEENEALTASAPVAGEHITDMVINVKTIHRTPPIPLVAPHLMRGPASLQRCGSAR